MTTPPWAMRHADGDRAALIAAHDAFAASLYDYCRWAVDDPKSAEDAVYVALLAAHAEPGLFHQPERLGPWLYAAARHECLRTTWWSGGSRSLGSSADGEGEPAANRQARERLAQVRHAAAQLGPRDQETAELALRHGLGPADVATILGTSTASTHAAVLRISAELSAACGHDARRLYTDSAPDAAPAGLYFRVIIAAAPTEKAAPVPGRATHTGRAALVRTLATARRPGAVALAAAAAGVSVLALGAIVITDKQTGTVAALPRSPEPSSQVSLDIAPPRGGAPLTTQPASPAIERQDRPARNLPDTPTSRPAQASPRPPTAGRPPTADRPSLLGSRSLQSVNYPQRYVRHQENLGRLDPVTASSSTLTKQDATFTVVAGLADPACYSFRSAGGRYLRHYAFRVRLHADNGTPLFRQDATFCARSRPIDGTMSLESYNYPGRFIRHRAFELWLDPADGTAGFRADSVFRAVAPWAP